MTVATLRDGSQGHPIWMGTVQGKSLGASSGFDGEGENWILWIGFAVLTIISTTLRSTLSEGYCIIPVGLTEVCSWRGDQEKTIINVQGTVNLNFISVLSMVVMGL